MQPTSSRARGLNKVWTRSNRCGRSGSPAERTEEPEKTETEMGEEENEAVPTSNVESMGSPMRTREGSEMGLNRTKRDQVDIERWLWRWSRDRVWVDSINFVSASIQAGVRYGVVQCWVNPIDVMRNARRELSVGTNEIDEV